MIRIFITPLIKVLLYVHTFLGKIIDVIAIRANGGLHPKHHLMRYYEFFLNHVNSTDTVLDIGCGNGFVSSQVARKVRNVVGIDTGAANIKHARRTHSGSNIEYILGDATTYPFTDTYDVVILSNVLEHIQDRDTFLRKIRPLALMFLVRVPMFDRDWLPLYKRELGMFPFSDTTHYTEYTLEQFERELTSAGYTIHEHTIRFGELWAVLKP